MEPSSNELPFVPPYLSLFLTALVVMGCPGPVTVSVTAVGAAFGVRLSLPYIGSLESTSSRCQGPHGVLVAGPAGRDAATFGRTVLRAHAFLGGVQRSRLRRPPVLRRCFSRCECGPVDFCIAPYRDDPRSAYENQI